MHKTLFTHYKSYLDTSLKISNKKRILVLVNDFSNLKCTWTYGVSMLITNTFRYPQYGRRVYDKF